MTSATDKADELRALILSGSTPVGDRLQPFTERIAEYYQLVLKWNGRLNLTTLTAPAQFLERHVVEVFEALHLIDPAVTSLWDLGSGLGVPGIPFKIFRSDLEVTLVESNRGKAIFLETVIAEMELDRARVEWKRVEDLAPLGPGALVTCRAIERMESLFQTILQCGAGATQILLFTTIPVAHSIPGAVVHPLPGAFNRCVAELNCSTWNTPEPIS